MKRWWVAVGVVLVFLGAWLSSIASKIGDNKSVAASPIESPERRPALGSALDDHISVDTLLQEPVVVHPQTQKELETSDAKAEKSGGAGVEVGQAVLARARVTGRTAPGHGQCLDQKELEKREKYLATFEPSGDMETDSDAEPGNRVLAAPETPRRLHVYAELTLNALTLEHGDEFSSPTLYLHQNVDEMQQHACVADSRLERRRLWWEYFHGDCLKVRFLQKDYSPGQRR